MIKKPLSRLVLGVGAPFVAIIYAFAAYSTGQVNPIRIWQVDKERTEIRQVEQRKYNELVDRLFGKNGFADTNTDGAISFEEMVDAYRRMGQRFEDTVFRSYEPGAMFSTSPFPKPTLSELETAVKNYR